VKLTTSKTLVFILFLVTLAIVITLYFFIRYSGSIIFYLLLFIILFSLIILIQKVRKDISKQALLEFKFKSLLDAAPDATVIVNEKGIVQMVNLQTEILFDYSRDELIGKPVELLVPEELAKGHSEHITKFVKEPRARSMDTGLLLEASKKDGTKFPVEISLSPLQTEEGLLISASLRDITKQRETADKFRKVEEEYHRMIDEVEDYAIILLDNDGRVKSWNKGAEKIKGYQAEEIMGKHFRVFYTKEDQELGLPEKLIEDAIQNGKATHEGWRVRKDGTNFWGVIIITALHDDDKKIVGFTKVTRDLTVRKRADEQIQKQKQDIQDIIDSMSTLCAKVSTSGKIILVNKIALEATGLTMEELLKINFVEGKWWTYDPEVHSRVQTAFEKACLGIISNYDENIFVFGHVRTMNFSLIPILNSDAQVDYIVAEARDITSLKLTEATLREQTLQLEAVNKELEAFTYSVSHDLRAPLRGIIGFTTILEEEYSNKLDDEAKRITAVIKNNTLKMGNLVDDLLVFSRMGRQDIVKTSINTWLMIHEVIEELSPKNDERIIEWVIQSLPWINADINTIRQVWVNLISNAIKYSGNNKHPRIEIGAFRHEGQTAFFIKDNGVGFDEKYKDKLFKVFQRLHGTEEFEGTGIGLALVEKIVSKHGGKVWAHGEVNKSASFYFSLPLDQGEETWQKQTEPIK
jgi:PAS domain S-box-containing protein